MSIDINRVYQKVLVLSNKEQRGYISPQEFNLLADKAQLDILDSYFHDVKTSYHKIKNETKFADEMEMLSEKLQPFKALTTINNDGTTNTLSLPDDLYRIETISRAEGEVIELSAKEILLTESNPLTKATVNRTVYVRDAGRKIELYPTPAPSQGQTIAFEIRYFKRPTTPVWAFVVTSGKALHNSTNSVDFILHKSEEENLVIRILELAGLTINRPDIQQAALVDKQATKQEQNN